MQPKKSAKVNIELRRREIFLMAFFLLLSVGYTLLEWRVAFEDDIDDAMLEEIVQDLDISQLKHDDDMVLAITESEEEEQVISDEVEITPVVLQPTQSELLIADGKSEVEEAKVEEAAPPVLLPEDKEKASSYKAVEELPEFPGGSSAFMKWITKNLKYPLAAKNVKVQGKVVISFVVGADGFAREFNVEKSDHQLLESAVLALMTKMPKWKPGKSGGEPTPVMVALPIYFQL